MLPLSHTPVLPCAELPLSCFAFTTLWLLYGYVFSLSGLPFTAYKQQHLTAFKVLGHLQKSETRELHLLTVSPEDVPSVSSV